MVKKYRIYIDESGDHTYHKVDNPEKRYLGLTGCFFDMEKYQIFQERLNELKKDNFKSDPDETIILHRKDIINKKGIFSILKNTEMESKFNSDLLKLFAESEYKIISVAIDKYSHIERYGSAAFHPYHYCLAALLERYCGYLNFTVARGDVLAESRGGTEDTHLKEAYKRIYNDGTNMRSKEFFQNTLTSCEIKLKPKYKNIAGLQLADLLAYPLKQLILVENNCISDPGDVFGKKVIDAISSKFNYHIYNGRIYGYGKIFIK